MAVHNFVKSIDTNTQPGAVWSANATVIYVTGDGQPDIVESYPVDPPLPDVLTAKVLYRQTQIAQTIVDPAGLKALMQLAGTEILPVPPVDPPPPDPEDVARNNFLSLFKQMQSAQKKVALGIILPDNAEFLALLSEAQKAYKADYLTLG